VGDTKAEENAWHAAFLAAVVNLFPNAEGHDKEWIEAKARCFAYHAITHPSDGSYCGLDSQTVWDDWHLENHGHENPVYIAGTLHLLGEAAFTYRLAGRPIPWEFTHNVQPLFWKYMTYVDRNIYHYANTPPGWGGAYDSAFISPTMFRYMDLLGVPTGISWQDYMSKRSIFYYDVSSMWLKKTPPYIRIRGWNQSDRNEDSYKFFLDSVTAGELYAMAMYSFLLLSPCEEDLYKEKAWAGVLNWTCDRSTHFAGSTSVRLSTPTDSSVEAYSPLKPVYPSHVYKISYAAKTSDLVKSLVEPATILARVVPAQYTSAAQEIDAVNAGNCVDSGLSHGVNQAGTTDWTSHSYDFATTGNTAFVRLRGILAGMGKGRGTAWFDDIELMPLYKHTVPASSVVASSTARLTSPRNVVDGNLSTGWSAFGDGEGIRLDLGVIRDVSAVRIAFYLGDRLTVDFDIQTSLDGAVWEAVFSGSSSGTTTQLEMFDVVESPARFVQVVSRRNRRNDWYSFTEIEVWGRLSSQYPSDGQIISLRSVHNSKYVAARGGENNWFLKAEGDTIGREDKYRITVNDDGTISLKSENNGRYVVARGGVNDWFLRAEGRIIGLEGKYTCIQNRDGTVSFRSENNGLYVAACGGENDWFLEAEGRTIGLEDKYEVIVVPYRREARAN
jgi:hypothetical protein